MSTETTPAGGRGVYKKLHAIMSEANYIQKDKRNEHFKYNYASEAAIKEKLHQLLVKHGVIFTTSGLNHQVVEYKRNERGQSQYRTTLDIAYRFYDIDDGSSVDGVMPGAGVDGEDKGTYKAITGAIKYILTSTFLIPTGDDPETEDKAISSAGTIEETIILQPRSKMDEVIGKAAEELEISDPLNKPEYISVHERSNLSKRFRESIRAELEPEASNYRHMALIALDQSKLFKSKLLDKDGNPTQDFILKSEYVAIGKELIKAAKSV